MSARKDLVIDVSEIDFRVNLKTVLLFYVVIRTVNNFQISTYFRLNIFELFWVVLSLRLQFSCIASNIRKTGGQSIERTSIALGGFS